MSNEIKPLKYVQASKTTMSFHSLSNAEDDPRSQNKNKNLYVGVKKTRFFWLDRLYMHRQARFDPETKRWFFPLMKDGLKEIRAKYWHLGGEESANQGSGSQTTSSNEVTCNSDLLSEIQHVLNKYSGANSK